MIELNLSMIENVSGGSFSSGEAAGEAAGAEFRKAFDGAMDAIQIGKWLGLLGDLG